MRPKIESVVIYIYTVYIPKFAMLIGQIQVSNFFLHLFWGCQKAPRNHPMFWMGAQGPPKSSQRLPTTPGPDLRLPNADSGQPFLWVKPGLFLVTGDLSNMKNKYLLMIFPNGMIFTC